MALFQRIYSRELEDAAVKAALDRGVGPARVIQEDIAAGRFHQDGVTFPAQNVPLDTVRAWIREEKKRRAGRVVSPLARIPHRDAIESLRLRLLVAADKILEAEERKGKKGDPARIQAVGRLIREAAAIPEKHDPRPAKPGQRDPETGEHNGSRTRVGLAAQIEAAHKRPTQLQEHGINPGIDPVQTEEVQSAGTSDQLPSTADHVLGTQHSEGVARLP